MRLQELLREVDDLSDEELEALYQHIIQRRAAHYGFIPARAMGALRAVIEPLYADAAHLSDGEIDDLIQQTLDEVRGE